MCPKYYDLDGWEFLGFDYTEMQGFANNFVKNTPNN